MQGNSNRLNRWPIECQMIFQELPTMKKGNSQNCNINDLRTIQQRQETEEIDLILELMNACLKINQNVIYFKICNYILP